MRLEEAVGARDLPECYFQHPLVQRAGGESLLLPVALYIDGVAYSQVDTAIGFWFVNLISGARYLIAVLRKASLCECGCRGWCSLAEVFKFVHWSMLALSEGVFPSRRHDGLEFRGSEAKRAELAGHPSKAEQFSFACTRGT